MTALAEILDVAVVELPALFSVQPSGTGCIASGSPFTKT